MKKKIVLRIVLISLGVLLVLGIAGIIGCNSYYGCNCGSKAKEGERFIFTLNPSGTEYSVTGYDEGLVAINTDLIIDASYENLPVTSIGNTTFFREKHIKSVVIPDSVTRIGWYAFYECNSLKTVTMSKNIKKIGWDAFRYCLSLTDIYYDGTIQEWNAISKGAQWCLGTTAVVHCLDGDIQL